MSYVYIQSEPTLWTVGYYTPNGAWHPESDWDSPRAAAERARWLNGGDDTTDAAPPTPHSQHYYSNDATISLNIDDKGGSVDLVLIKTNVTLHFVCTSAATAERLAEAIASATLTIHTWSNA